MLDIPFYWAVSGRNIFKRSDFWSDFGFFGRIMIKPTDCSLSISTLTRFCLSVFLHSILLIVCQHNEVVVPPSYWLASIFFSSLYQNRVMNLDRTNRIFYKEVIMDEKRKERYHELDSLIHSDLFYKTYWSLEH